MTMEADNFTGGQLSSPLAAGPGTDFDPRYLAAKKSIDDRAMNRYVWSELCQVPAADNRSCVRKHR
jgi:hypothetical protein